MIYIEVVGRMHESDPCAPKGAGVGKGPGLAAAVADAILELDDHSEDVDYMSGPDVHCYVRVRLIDRGP